MSTEWMIRFEHEKCTQCHGCEVACRSWRGLHQGVSYRRVLNVWRGGYPDVKNHSVSLGCLHCVEPRCVAACSEEAIIKRKSDGLVWVSEAFCTGCEACLDACPYGVPQFGPEGIMEKCDFCIGQVGREYGPPCVITCPGGALSMRKVTPGEKEGHQKTILALMA
jgi:anaerobic dimethyl sulfoxide reductase subunit B (iron-sulfur subunit)